uniref:Uncharacterized protein n=1 Tax=Rhizophora mucronata TaxID=61149 RepID=A0A2P2PKV3_RHIMU
MQLHANKYWRAQLHLCMLPLPLIIYGSLSLAIKSSLFGASSRWRCPSSNKMLLNQKQSALFMEMTLRPLTPLMAGMD